MASNGDAVKPGLARRIAQVVLIGLASLLIALSTVAVWTARTVLDSEKFASDVGKSLDDERVTDALATYLTTQLLQLVNFDEIVKNALPDKLEVLAPPIIRATEQFVQERVAAVVASDEFTTFFTDVVEKAHQGALRLIKGETGPAVDVNDDTIVINLVPVIAAVLTRLGADGLVDTLSNLPTLADHPQAAEVASRLADHFGVTLPKDFAQITVVRGDTLDTLQQVLQLTRRTVWLLLIVSVVLVAVAIVLAPNRRRAVVQLGIGVAVSEVLMWILFLAAGNSLIDAVAEHTGNTEGAPATEAIVDVLENNLQTVVVVTVFFGCAVALAAWLIGLGQRSEAADSEETGDETGDAGQGEAVEPASGDDGDHSLSPSEG